MTDPIKRDLIITDGSLLSLNHRRTITEDYAIIDGQFQMLRSFEITGTAKLELEGDAELFII